jgi:hypothetical protein
MKQFKDAEPAGGMTRIAARKTHRQPFVSRRAHSSVLADRQVHDIPPGMMQIGKTVLCLSSGGRHGSGGEVRCDDHKKIRPFQT